MLNEAPQTIINITSLTHQHLTDSTPLTLLNELGTWRWHEPWIEK